MLLQIAEIAYRDLFHIGIIIQVVLTAITILAFSQMNKDSVYRPIVKVFAIIFVVTLVILGISYIAQDTFMGWM